MLLYESTSYITFHYIIVCVSLYTAVVHTTSQSIDALIIFAFNLRTIVVARMLSVYRGEGQAMSGAGIL